MRYCNCLKLFFFTSLILTVIKSSEDNSTNLLNSIQTNNQTQSMNKTQEINEPSIKAPEPVVETSKTQETQHPKTVETIQEKGKTQEPVKETPAAEQPRLYNENDEELEYHEQGIYLTKYLDQYR